MSLGEGGEQGSLFDESLPHFNGADYEYKRDHLRLSGQYRDIFNLMRDGEWRSLPQIARITGHPEASISAQLRHMRKPRFGSHTVNRRHVTDGLNEYQLVVNEEASNASAAGGTPR